MLITAALVATFARGQSNSGTTRSQGVPPPYWAFAVNPLLGKSDAPATIEDSAPRHVPGSAIAFTPAQIGNFFSAPDWHSADHPRMPSVVAHGRPPVMFACAHCHLPNGQGRPENASLAGLPADYIIQQIQEFASGRRGSSEPRHGPTFMMITVAKEAGPADVKAAATYFSSLRRRPWIRVVETPLVPTTRVAGWMLVLATSGGTEPIRERIIETPANLDRTELRDDRSGFIAYVPPDSLETGALLVNTGASGKTIPCATCHGPGLRGLGIVPRLAGRSPSYIVRQLYDIQHGTRTGPDVALMQVPVANLTEADMVAIAAYITSLPP
jgi:cytochrome c553